MSSNHHRRAAMVRYDACSARPAMTALAPGQIVLIFFEAVAVLNLCSIAVAAWRVRRRRPTELSPNPEPVSLVIPCRGVEPFTAETLNAAYALDYPAYELIFCVADAEDPIVPAIRRRMSERPDIPARLLIGDERISDNPKLNNCAKGWNAARHDWVVLADSNVLMPRDYIQHLLSAWRPESGLVCSPPIGGLASGFWALVECAFLNTLQARWQYAAEAGGLGFAQGKSMLWRRPMLNAEGGIDALAREIAEDAAATKVVRGIGRHVHLVDQPFVQPLGKRSLASVWSRQIRWARLRRVTFALYFAPEILSSALVPALGVGFGLAATGIGPAQALLGGLGVLAATYAGEMALGAAKGWQTSWRMPLAMLVRDALLLIVWTAAWLGTNVVWQGQAMRVRRGADETESPSPA
jgi:ceramide glucosyltransferase